MEKFEFDNCCESGVKGSCFTCNNSSHCYHKWSRETGQGSDAVELSSNDSEMLFFY